VVSAGRNELRALVDLADRARSGRGSGEGSRRPRAGHAAKDQCASSEIIIHIDRALTELDATLSARLQDGTPVSAETLRRVCCDGGIVPAAVDDRGAVLDLSGRR
jgi:hypothetical protein